MSGACRTLSEDTKLCENSVCGGSNCRKFCRADVLQWCRAGAFWAINMIHKLKEKTTP